MAVYITTAKLKSAKISYSHIYIWRSRTEPPNLIFLQLRFWVQLPNLILANISGYTVSLLHIVISLIHCTCKIVGNIASPSRSSDSGESPHPHETDDREDDQIDILQPPIAKDLAKLDHFVLSLHSHTEVGNGGLGVVGAQDLLSGR